jgi:hypothetical protein
MATDSTWQLRRKNPVDVDNASSADQLRFFLDDTTGLLATKDNVGTVTIIGGTTGVAFTHNPPIVTPAPPYPASIRETVKVDPTGGPAVVTLPTAVGQAGQRIKVINLAPVPGPIDVNPFGGETIDGQPSYQLNTPQERAEFESDGANWIVVG